MKNVQIYSTPTCVYCKHAKEYFAENNIAFTEHNVASDLDARKEMLEKTGQMGVPVIVIDGEVTVGFDKEAIAAQLGL
jgi:glutaredoxin-like YruB-family protein